jgi:hypothetical protein
MNGRIAGEEASHVFRRSRAVGDEPRGARKTF